MALNKASADAVGTAIASALGVTNSAAIANWQKVVEQIFSGIVSDGIVTIPASSIITTGSPSTQTGPSAPVMLAIS